MFESAVKVGLQGYFGYIRNGYGLSSSRLFEYASNKEVFKPTMRTM